MKTIPKFNFLSHNLYNSKFWQWWPLRCEFFEENLCNIRSSCQWSTPPHPPNYEFFEESVWSAQNSWPFYKLYGGMVSYTWKNQQWHPLKPHDFSHKKDIWKTFEAFNDEIEEEPPHSQFNMSIAKKQTNTPPQPMFFQNKSKQRTWWLH